MTQTQAMTQAQTCAAGRGGAQALAAGGEIMQEDCREEYLNALFSAEKLLSGVLETRKRLFSNVSWQQALEMLFFEIVSGGK